MDIYPANEEGNNRLDKQMSPKMIPHLAVNKGIKFCMLLRSGGIILAAQNHCFYAVIAAQRSPTPFIMTNASQPNTCMQVIPKTVNCAKNACET